MPWHHNYAALGNSLALTALVVAIPIAFLFWALAYKRMRGHVAGVLTLLLTLVVTILVYRMPVTVGVSAACLGIVTGLFPLCWIIVTAVFMYNLTVEAGQFEVLKSSISALSTDRRMQALLIGFCFSAFIEGVAGQGAPVAVAAAMLIGLGFPPLPAAVLCLVANTPPVPFGPVGVPTLMMGTVTGMSTGTISRAVGLDMTLMAMIIPFMTLVVLAGKQGLAVWPAALVTALSYALTTLIVSQTGVAELPAILSSFVSIVALAIFLKFWQPKTIWRFPNDPVTDTVAQSRYTTAQVIKAWSPWLVLMLIMGIWGIPAFKKWIMGDLHWYAIIPRWPGLDGVVFRTAPIVAKPAKYAASYRWEFFTTPGTAMFLTSLVTMAILKISPARGVKVFIKTFKQLRFALVTLASVIGIGFLANYSGMSYTLGLAFAVYTGMFFPLFSPVIGWLGVFLTGSVTSSAAIFGKLQQVTATAIGLNPVLTTSANLFGGVMGKLISPQSIAVACAATGLVGRETDLFRGTIKYSVVLLVFTMLIVFMQAYLFPGIIPVDITFKP
jgi:lactate permease